ncbi:MAG: VCBS repeat-containing protein, partial [Gammaproteobacteria bacterium]|nr:VCBS repeat-containing protein [Gammaproteobacteria bacterium]
MIGSYLPAIAEHDAVQECLPFRLPLLDCMTYRARPTVAGSPMDRHASQMRRLNWMLPCRRICLVFFLVAIATTALADSGEVFEFGFDLDTAERDTKAIVAADLDCDGDMDIVEGNTNYSVNKVFLNDGKGSFPEIIDFGVSTTTDTLVVADLDNDGDEDLVSGNAYGRNQYFLNRGCTASGWLGLATGQDIGFADNQTLVMAAADVNSDGFPDLVVGNASQLNLLYLNKGLNGQTWLGFHPAVSISEAKDYTTSLVVGDLDGDGDQ